MHDNCILMHSLYQQNYIACNYECWQMYWWGCVCSKFNQCGFAHLRQALHWTLNLSVIINSAKEIASKLLWYYCFHESSQCSTGHSISMIYFHMRISLSQYQATILPSHANYLHPGPDNTVNHNTYTSRPWQAGFHFPLQPSKICTAFIM